MNLQPTLRGNLVTLQPLAESDFERLYAVASDPEIWKLHPEPNRFERPVFEKFFIKAIRTHSAFLILEKATGQVIGSSRYYEYEEEKKAIKIGYTFYARKFWGGTFNREIKALMLMHIFQYVEKVQFQIGENNLRSRRAIEKIGAKLVGTVLVDIGMHCIYEIEKNNFRQN